MSILSVVVTILFIANFIFAGIIIFLERRDPAATWAWLMILFFVPFVGFIFYIIFGQNLSRKRLFSWKDIEKVGISDVIANQLQAIRTNRFLFQDMNVENNRDLIYMLLMNNGAVFTQDNELSIMTDGHDKFEQLFRDIEAAEDHIHVQYYIFRKDALGERLIEALAEKARQGVKVRFLYDDLGSRSLSRRQFRSILDSGGDVGVFFPSKIPYVNLRLNYRNHRKMVIIDGEIGYTGGFNVGDEYLGLSKKFGYWRDTQIRLEGSAVDTLQTRFFLDWNQAVKERSLQYDPRYFPDKEPKGHTPIQVVTSGPDSEWEQIKNGYLKLITSAKESVYIQTPYFIPDTSLLDALRIAALSGKDVRIMIPNKPDHIFVYWATYWYMGELLKAGARFYIYDNGFMHSKTMVVDRKVSSVGTANIDVRSFRLNFEVNAFIYHEETSRQLADIFEDDMTYSWEMTEERYAQRSLWIRFKESISRLLSPIL
ncbi:cardiolipin synthase [Salsuginibacillus halophilus]|uniref:Cardiolipin synthase n=1 Tax=Salsuginibacillus halophilus TaxID=517424 RepID=A0A2P8H3M6_9BACI|nr:cardiolipin synthase [Salsuginibacillus halophilus]PSL40818.1 cardiolipin synthase [Salsuginibacillus halophilus]